MTATTDIATFDAARRRPGERRRSRIILTLLLSLFLVYGFVPLVLPMIGLYWLRLGRDGTSLARRIVIAR